MKPYFEKNGIQIYHGECHDIMAGLAPGSFDALVADPPYCSGAGTLAGKSVNPVEKYSSSKTDQGRGAFSGDAKDQRSFVA